MGKVYEIDMGDTPTEKVKQYVEEIMAKHKNRQEAPEKVAFDKPEAVEDEK